MKNKIKLYTFFLLVISINVLPQEKLKEGSKAPDFTLQDAYGNEYSLSSYIGKSPVVIYFYPKANTSGCTKQACAIRDDWDKFKSNNIQVFGISTDSQEEIKKFVVDFNLNFPLLSDADKIVSKKYNVLRESGSAKRVTFIIDPKGNIDEILEVRDIESHSDYIFKEASRLNSDEENTD